MHASERKFAGCGDGNARHHGMRASPLRNRERSDKAGRRPSFRSAMQRQDHPAAVSAFAKTSDTRDELMLLASEPGLERSARKARPSRDAAAAVSMAGR